MELLCCFAAALPGVPGFGSACNEYFCLFPSCSLPTCFLHALVSPKWPFGIVPLPVPNPLGARSPLVQGCATGLLLSHPSPFLPVLHLSSDWAGMDQRNGHRKQNLAGTATDREQAKVNLAKYTNVCFGRLQ